MTEVNIRRIQKVLTMGLKVPSIAKALDLSTIRVTGLMKRAKSINLDHTFLSYSPVGSVDMHDWILAHYIPTCKISKDGDKSEYHYEVKYYNIDRLACPTRMHEPGCTMREFDVLAFTYTTKILLELNTLSKIDRIIRSVNEGATKMHDDDVEDLAIIMDQAIIKRYKSMSNLADEAYRYICSF